MTRRKQREPVRVVVVPEGYEITADGRVISHRKLTPRELKPNLNGSGDGYPSVWLYRDGRRWHVAVYRLVAAAHLPKRPSNKHFVLHRDGDRANSAAANLYWGTASENMYDCWRHRRERQQYGAPLHVEHGMSA